LIACGGAGVLCQARHGGDGGCPQSPAPPNPIWRAAAGSAILRGGGDIDFLIIGSTPMANPAMFFGNPHPSERKLRHGDIVIMELAGGLSRLHGPDRLADLHRRASRNGEEVSGTRSRSPAIGGSSPRSGPATRSIMSRHRGAGSFATRACSLARRKSTASISSPRPRTCFAERTEAREDDKVFKPGMVTMAEPNPITADGLFGIFLGPHFHCHAGGP